MRSAPAALLLAFLVIGWSGCILPGRTEPTTSLVLTYELIDLRPGDPEYREANAGHHCGTAYVRDGVLHIQEDVLAEIGPRRPILLVDPDLEGRWATLGDEGFPMAVPADVGADAEDVPDPIVRIGWTADGNATVDGARVGLPYTWSRTDPAGTWRIEAQLVFGPTRLAEFPAYPCD